MSTIYGYERYTSRDLVDKYEEGMDLWFKIIELLLSFVGTMQKTHDFDFYAYGVADVEGIYKWMLNSTKHEISAEEIYSEFPKEYVTI